MDTDMITEPPTVTPDPREIAARYILRQLEASAVPPTLHEGLARYFCAGIQPGSFLTAVLSSDLPAAIVRADDDNILAFGHLVMWLYAFAPAKSWGSAENVAEWLGREEWNRDYAKRNGVSL